MSEEVAQRLIASLVEAWREKQLAGGAALWLIGQILSADIEPGAVGSERAWPADPPAC